MKGSSTEWEKVLDQVEGMGSHLANAVKAVLIDYGTGVISGEEKPAPIKCSEKHTVFLGKLSETRDRISQYFCYEERQCPG